MQIVIKKSPREMLNGIGLDSKQIQRVTLAIGKAVEESFSKRNETMVEQESEVYRRTDFCFKEVLKMICDYDFAIREVETNLPTSLRYHLIGMEYQPSARMLDGHKPS